MLNFVNIIGKISDDVRKNESNGRSVANFSVNVDRVFSKGYDILNCVVWGDAAEQVAKYEKGQQVALHGRLQNRSYTDKDGNKRVVSEIIVDAITAVGPDAVHMNNICVMGRLTRDPEARSTGDVSVANFSIANERDYAPKNGGDRECDFLNCVAWRGTGDFVSKYFTKGRMAVVNGRLQINSYTDKEGNKRRNAEIVAENVYFGDNKSGAAPAAAAPATVQTAKSDTPPFSVVEEDEDVQLPF